MEGKRGNGGGEGEPSFVSATIRLGLVEMSGLKKTFNIVLYSPFKKTFPFYSEYFAAFVVN